MSFHQQNVQRVRKEYATKYLHARDDADRRRREAELTIPALIPLHRELASTGLEIMRVSLQAPSEQQRAEALAALRQKNEQLLAQRVSLLLGAGLPADYTELRYECDKCSDSGYLDSGRMCDCMRRSLILAGYEASGLGTLLQQQSFDNFSLDYYRSDEKTYRTMSMIYRALREYAAQFTTEHAASMPCAGNLLLVGGTGLGKTHLSTAIAKELLDRGVDVLYTTAVNMVSCFEAARFGNAATPTDGLSPERYLQCELLIVDDLGTEVSNQFTVSTLYTLIDSRLNARKPTIISTNLMQDELRHRYWDRITSRLLGEYRTLLFLGTDVRAQKLRAAHN